MSGEQLFLIEVLVDNISILVIRAIHKEILPAKTCISFQILDLPPLNIYQETQTEACACADSEQLLFKKGKSCLFALPNSALQKPLSSFPITMTVYKQFPPGVLPDVMLIGSHQIQARDLINSLLGQQNLKTDDTSRTLKDTFKITTTTGQCVGKATVFIRISCFGRKIVTQFQTSRTGEHYFFKGIDDSPVFRCKRITSVTDKDRVRRVCPAKKSGDGSGETTRTYVIPTVSECQRKDSQQDVKKVKCPLCCPAKQDIVRKCGCIVKTERTCDCSEIKPSGTK